MKHRRRQKHRPHTEQRLGFRLAGLAFLPGLISLPVGAQNDDWSCLPAPNGIDWVCRDTGGREVSTAREAGPAIAAPVTAVDSPSAATKPAPETPSDSPAETPAESSAETQTASPEPTEPEPATPAPVAQAPEPAPRPAPPSAPSSTPEPVPEPVTEPRPAARPEPAANRELAVETTNTEPAAAPGRAARQPAVDAGPVSPSTAETGSTSETEVEQARTESPPAAAPRRADATTEPVDEPVQAAADPSPEPEPEPEPEPTVAEATPDVEPLPETGTESYRPQGWPLPPADDRLEEIARVLKADDFGKSILRTNSPLLCGTPSGKTELPWRDDDQVHISADRIETGSAEGETLVIGEVVVQYGRQAIAAEQARVNRQTQDVELEGGVRYRDSLMGVESDRGQVNLVQSTGHFEQVNYYLQEQHAHGGAEQVEIHNPNQVTLTEGSYTTCVPGKNHWVLISDSIELNKETGRGTARNTTLRLGDVPVFYFPYLDFPIDDRRQSGFLMPRVGSANKHGFTAKAPYYFNLAPNYDLTLTPGLYEKRGAVLESEGRYLFGGGHSGSINADVLPDDDVFGDERYLLGWTHVFRPNENWRTDVNLQEASDQRYLEDFGSGLLETSSSHLHRYVSVTRDNRDSSLSIRLDDYRMMDSTVVNSPYQVLPRVTYARDLRFPRQEMVANLNLDLASFNRNSRVEGWRVNSQPEVRWPMRQAWGGIEPKLKFDLTQYELDNTAAGTDSSPSRAIPMVRIDGDLVFEKGVTLGDSGFTHTIEPRAMYLYVPRDDQSNFPVFDTNTLTPSYHGLFYDNRFAGGDRIGDTNQLSLGVSSRLLSDSSGAEILRADLGVAYFFEDRIEQLPGVARQTSDTSEYVGRIRSELGYDWYTEVEAAFDADSSDTLKSNFEAGYQPGNGNAFNLQHRYLVDNTGHSMVSGSWRLGSRYTLVAAYDYSHRTNRAIDILAGLEYGSCCWATRLVARRYQTDSSGQIDNAIMLEFELKGLAGIGDSVRSTLDDRIDGYVADD